LAEAGSRLLAFHRAAAEDLMKDAEQRWDKLAQRKPYWRLK
jgi:hypothetical protein